MLNIKMYESKIQKRLEVNIRIENTYLPTLWIIAIDFVMPASLLCSWCKNVLPVFSPRTAAIYYFITALFMLLACFDTYFALPLNVSTPGPKTALLEKFWQI